ncbi:MAG: hypothetical protein BIFFINMI_02277 [Phycisphaerae bacterium]|nr:hypothetical protein [Phycisphaerae bacterium]
MLQMLASSDEQVRPRFNQWLGVLASVLAGEGHELRLRAFSRYQSGHLHDEICRFLPQLIYIDADRFAADVTRHAVEFVGRNHALPVIVGGAYPTAQPDQALSIPGVLAIAIGEPESCVPRFIDARATGDSFEQTPGLWANTGAGVVKNDLASLTQSLDLLPFADRELFDYATHVTRTHSAQVSVCRGCPNRCSYCLNDWLTEIYLGKGPWVRRRSPANICDEIDTLCSRYEQIERLVFVDHAFALDAEWLAQFARVYAGRAGMPFTCHLRANAVDADTVRLLTDAGCAHAVVEVISGSDFIRNEIFDMDTTDRQIERTFRLLEAAGISTTAVNLVGSPYETAVTVEQTLTLNERIDPKHTMTRLFAPLPGTRAEELVQECGWLRGLGEHAFRDNEPLIHMPALPSDEVRAIFDQFNWQARHPRAAGLMRLLDRIPVAPGRSLYDLFVRQPVPNGRLLPADPRAIAVTESDGVIAP